MTAPQRPATVLVVDDREENRMVIRYLFDGPDYRVLEAAEGASGLALARDERPDCILLDLSMPGLSGFEVLERLQADPRTREIPVLILTATGDQLEAMERALRGGAMDYITKPISADRVAVRVRGAIERRRLLEELNELRAGFTSMLVHDLRAPLSVIKGYADLMPLGGGLSDKQRRYVAEMQEACERMLKLIGEILDVSKLEAGRLSLDVRPSDLGKLIYEVVDRLAPLASKKAIKLQIHGDELRQPVAIDPGRIEQVLMNLLSNALKFTPEHGAVSVEIQDGDDGVQVTVADSGPGIGPEEMPVLFEKFCQGQAGKTARDPGTGLGLVICRHLVEAHGGRIWAESEPGKGTRFVFHLPRARRSDS